MDFSDRGSLQYLTMLVPLTDYVAIIIFYTDDFGNMLKCCLTKLLQTATCFFVCLAKSSWWMEVSFLGNMVNMWLGKGGPAP